MATGKSTIKICDICKGAGKIEKSSSWDAYDYVSEECDVCKGSGKVVELTYKITIPYDAHKTSYHYNSDTKIHDLLRQIESEIKSEGFKRDLNINEIIE